ncbi:MAG: AraC family transcriptional regulator [Bacteroidota bacterium]
MEQPDYKSTVERHILDLGSLGFQCVKALGKYNYRKIRRSLEMHKHEGMLEICYLDKGTQYYNIEGKDYHLKGGDLLLTFPGEEHGTMEFPEEKGRLFWLILTLPGSGSNQRLLNLTPKESGVLTDRLLQLQSNRMFQGSLHLKNHLNRIYQIYNEKEPVYKKIQITNLLLGFLIHVVEFGEQSTESRVSETIDQICLFIHNNIHDELKLEIIAAKWHLSLSHFKYRFKQEIGIPPADYILRQKINAAKEMLLADHPVQEVAYGLAFSSPSYFSTVFKRYTGKSPTQYFMEKSDPQHQDADFTKSH